MTVTMYQWHSEAVQLCVDAKEAFEQPNAFSKFQGIGYLALARFACLAISFKGAADCVLLLWKRVVKIISIPFDGNFSLSSLVRAGIATALAATVVVFRVVFSLAGVLSPELTFWLLNAHRFLLRVGLIWRSQLAAGRMELPSGDTIHMMITDQRRRWAVVEDALRQIDTHQAHHERLFTESFFSDVWLSALLRARLDGSERRAGAAAVEEGAGARVADEDADFGEWGAAPADDHMHDVPDIAAALEGEFGRPVHVSHPILEAFQEKFSRVLHQEALEVCRQGLYTKAEVEDMETAFLAVMNRATLQAILASFSLARQELSLGSREITTTALEEADGQRSVLTDVLLEHGQTATIRERILADGQSSRSLVASRPEGWVFARESRVLASDERILVDEIVLLDGKRLEGRDAGGLEEWKDRLLEIFVLVGGMTRAERSAFLDDLCADEERVHRVRPEFVRLSSRPVQDRCFKLIVEFYTTFVAHHMPGDTGALQRAFAL